MIFLYFLSFITSLYLISSSQHTDPQRLFRFQNIIFIYFDGSLTWTSNLTSKYIFFVFYVIGLLPILYYKPHITLIATSFEIATRAKIDQQESWVMMNIHVKSVDRTQTELTNTVRSYIMTVGVIPGIQGFQHTQINKCNGTCKQA